VTEKGPSQTAIRTGMRRAAHYLLDAEPKILADVFAQALAGFSSDEEFLRTRDAVLRTLREVAAFSTTESTLVMEFIAPLRTLTDEEAALVNSLAEASAKLGEPWLSFFTSEDRQAALTQAGFRAVEHFGPAETFARYLRGRTDGARLPGYFRMAKATARPTTVTGP
jgi:O-methyltransferase involved in polyketide biosynthesis